MKEAERLGLLYKVASLYYEGRLKKFQIAAKIDQSATQVANLLREAEKEGIVRIEVNLPLLQELQKELRNKFPFLQDAVVIPYETDCALLLKLLGKAAAEYFDDRVEPGMKLALGGGYLIYEMLSALPEKKRDIDVYPTALIGRGPTILHIDPMVTVTLLWAKSGRHPGRAHCISVPQLESRDENFKTAKRIYAKLLERDKVRQVYGGMKDVNIVFSSIGALNADPDYRAATQYATKNLLSEMTITGADLAGAVGDINYSFFNKDGATKSEWNPFLSLGVDEMASIAASPQRRAVVVTGSYKMEALEAVMAGRLCNVLITDALAAEQLIQKK